MKSHRLAIALFLPLILACILGAVALRHHFGLFYPIPETESVFLCSYTPKQVIDHFRESESFSYTQHTGGGAGRTFVTHEAGFEFHIVLRREKWASLMNALQDDVLRQLANNGAEVLSQSSNPQDGLRFNYEINQSIGSLTISPLKINSPSRRKMSLPEGEEDVIIKIDQTERWFPKRIGTIRASSFSQGRSRDHGFEHFNLNTRLPIRVPLRGLMFVLC